MLIEQGTISTEPISRADAKTHLQIEHTGDDDYIDDLISSARSHLESLTHRAFTNRTVTLIVDSADVQNGQLVLPWPKLVSIDTFEYYSSDLQTLTDVPAANYTTIGSDPGTLVAINGGFTSSRYEYTWKITMTCGYGGTMPPDVLAAMRSILYILYHFPGSISTGQLIRELGTSYDNLIVPLRHIVP